MSFSAGRRCHQSSSVGLQTEAAGQKGGAVTENRLTCRVCMLWRRGSLQATRSLLLSEFSSECADGGLVATVNLQLKPPGFAEPTKHLQVPDIKVYFFFIRLSSIASNSDWQQYATGQKFDSSLASVLKAVIESEVRGKKTVLFVERNFGFVLLYVYNHISTLEY